MSGMQYAVGFLGALGFTLVLHGRLLADTSRQLALLDLVEKDVRGEVCMRAEVEEEKSVATYLREAYSRKWLNAIVSTK
jgi:hypothetical protein